MARYHPVDYRNFYTLDPDVAITDDHRNACTDDDCTRDHVHVFTDDELDNYVNADIAEARG